MSELIQVIPALRQSHVEIAACPRAYVAIVIDGHEQPDSIPSERGSEIHHVMSQYVSHCAAAKVESDWVYFNKLTVAAGPVAGPILDNLRNIFRVDWKRVYGTEVTLALDEDFNPAYFTMKEGGEMYELERIPGVVYSEKPAAHIGTLDVILLTEDMQHGKIPDYKSHPAPFEADTFQSTLYPFMLLKHFPTLQDVKFELNFVRYTGSLRAVSWTRDEMPAMQAEISRARQRQIATHEHPDKALALPCKTCTYCPLGKAMTCPIGEWNEYLTMTPQQRLIWKEWLRRMAAFNSPLLKQFAEVNGNISYTDGNGKVYEYGEMPVAHTRYPLDDTSIRLLAEYAIATGENLLDGRLNISSTKLKSLLKTKKREALRDDFEASVIQTETKPKYAVRTPEGTTEEDFNPYAQED